MTPARFVTLLLGVALITGSGCKRATRADDPVLLRVTVDGAEVSRVRGSELAKERLLLPMLPVAAQDVSRWTRWRARSADGRTLTIVDPSEDYDDHDILLRTEAGQVHVAVKRRAHPGQPPHLQKLLDTPEEELVGAVMLEIETGQPVAGGPDSPAAAPRPAALTIVRAGQSQVLAASAFDGLPQAPDHGHDKDGGWQLRDVLAAAGVSGTPDIVAVGREGTQEVRGADLGAAMLRRNRRGQLRLTAAGAGGATVVLHAVERLEIR